MREVTGLLSPAAALWIAGLMLPWLFALVLALWPRRLDRLAFHAALAGALLTTLSIGGSQLARPARGETEILLRVAWIPEAGLELFFIRDGLAMMFALLVAGIAAMVVLYAWRYLPHANEHEESRRKESSFYALMLAFTGAMLGVVSSGHLVQLYVFWELTALASYLLIGYWRQHREARRGAFLSLGVTAAGGVAMLAGLLILAFGAGEWSLAGLVAGDPPEGPWLEACAALVVLGALTKSAQYPFSNWLPAAMIAPTPVSALLHSSALVAAGVYLLARFFPVLHGAQAWRWMLLLPGVVGAAYVGLIAVRQIRIKALLAYSTIGQYAYMFIGFGLATATGVKAALYAFFVHALIKAGLFLVAGSVTHLTGRKELDRVGGMGRAHPVLGLLGVVLALSLGGVPVMGGFYYKEELLHAVWEQQAWILLGAMLLGGMFSLMYMLRFLNEIYFGPGDKGDPRPLPVSMGLPIALLAGAAVVTAIFPLWMDRVVLNEAIAVSLGHASPLEVGLEIGYLFFTSMGTLSAAFLLWLAWKRLRVLQRWWEAIPEGFRFGGRRLRRAYGLAAGAALSLHNGSLPRYLRWVLGLFLLGVIWLWRDASMGEGWAPVQPVLRPLSLLLLLVILTSLATLFVRRHVSLAMLLTLVGFALAAAFVLMRAPDVALAQVLVETLATLSVVLAIQLTGRIDPDTSVMPREWNRDWLRLGLALGVGMAAGTGTYLAARHYPAQAMGQAHIAAAPEAGKQDFVVAILSDFRALDTLVEIAVFATSILAVAGVFRRRRGKHDRG